MKNYKERFRKLAIMGSSLAALTIASNQVAIAQSANQDSAQTADDNAPQGESQSDGKQDAKPDDIVVTGFAASLETSIGKKRAATQIIDVISAEDLADFPDQNVVEALGRVTGVQIQRDNTGEGDRFQVRGNNDIRIEIDGQRQVGGRFDGGVVGSALPSEIFGSVEVVKTQSASDVEGASGGIVRLNTREVLGAKKDFSLAASAENGYSENSKKFGYVLSATVGKNFRNTAIGDFGFNASYVRSRNQGQADAYEAGGFTLDNSLREDINGNGIANELVTFGVGPGGLPVVTSRGDAVIRPNTVGASFNRIDRRERSINVNAQWQPSDNFDIYGKVTLSRQGNRDERASYNLTVPTLSTLPRNALVIENGVLVSALLPSVGGLATPAIRPDFAVDQNTYQGGFKWDITSKLRFEGRYQRGEGDTVNPIRVPIIVATQLARVSDFNFDNRTTVPTVFPTNGSNGFGDFQNALFIGLVDLDIFEQQRNEAFQADLTYQIDAGFLSRIRLGGRYSKDRQRLVQNNRDQFIFSGTSNSPFAFSPIAGLQAREPDFIRVITRNNSFGGQNNNNLVTTFNAFNLDLFSQPRFQNVRIDNILLDRNNPNSFGQVTVNQVAQREGTQEIWAGYVVADLEGTFPIFDLPFNGNIGARLVNTKRRFIGTFADAAGNTRLGDDSSQYLKLLPSLNLNFDLTNKLKLRVGLGRTISRPNFEVQTPTITRLPNQNVFQIGNPGIRPAVVDALDGSIEWYFQKGGLLSFAGFYKKQRDISGQFVSRQCLPDTDSPAVRPNQGGVGIFRDPIGVQVCTEAGLGSEADLQRNDFFTVTDTRNIGNGFVAGFEASYQQNFSFLPSPFDGFGTILNYTFTDGINPQISPLGVRLPILAASRHTFNSTLYYEKGALSTRVTYNYRSKYLQDGAVGLVENIEGSPEIRSSFGQLDAAFSYKVADKLTFSIDAFNILRETQDSFADFREALLRRRFTDRRIQFGVRVGF
jgi:iron complex outermembrane recepter protein